MDPAHPVPNRLQLKIGNLHCSGCEIVVERKFKTIPGVLGVRVSHTTGRAAVFITKGCKFRLQEFEQAVSNPKDPFR